MGLVPVFPSEMERGLLLGGLEKRGGRKRIGNTRCWEDGRSRFVAAAQNWGLGFFCSVLSTVHLGWDP